MEEKSWLERHWKKWLPAALSANAALSGIWWAATDDWLSALAGFNAGAMVCAGMVGFALRRARRRTREAEQRKSDEAEVDLNDLKTRLEEIGAEAFDEEVSRIQVRVPSTHPPPSGPIRSVSELLAEDVDPEEIGKLLARGHARRD